MLDDRLLEKAGRFARQAGRPLRVVLAEALDRYLKKESQGQGPSSVEATFGALRLPRRAVRLIAEADLYDAG